MVYHFKEGKYPGKTVEQVALIDYSHLKTMYNKRKAENKDDFLTKNIETVIERLNNFLPEVQCKDPGCKNIANYLPISLTVGEYQVQKNGQPLTRVGVTEVSIPEDKSYCENHRSIYHKLVSKEVLYEIKFDTITELREKHQFWQRWVSDPKLIQKAILKCAGFKGNKTPKKCSDFIYNLPQKEGEFKYNFKTTAESIPKLVSGLKDDFYSNDLSVIEVEKNIAIYLKNSNDDNGESLAIRLDGLGNSKEGIDRLNYISKKYSQKFGVEKTKKLLGGYYTISKK